MHSSSLRPIRPIRPCWRRATRGAALACAVLWLAAPAAYADDADAWRVRLGWGGVTGSGTLKTEPRAVSGFRAIALTGSVNAVLRQGAREGVALRADDNVLPLIETRVVDRDGVPTLEIGSRHGASYSTRNPVVATIDLTTLDALRISGSAEVSCDALTTGALRVAVSGSGRIRMSQLVADAIVTQVSGSGDIAFSGRATRLGVSISGSGDVDTRALDADDVDVRVAGSGDATVNARKTLTVSIAGNGSVAYTGDARVKSSVAGHGSIRKQ
jgi:hypothetical protein